MAWSGSYPSGAFTRTDGVNSGANVWLQDYQSGNDQISPTREDTHDYDMAQAINLCLHKGGINIPTGHLNWVNTEYWGTTGGTANAQTLTLNNAPSAIYDGMKVHCVIGSGLTNTSTMTLNVNGTGAKDVKDNRGLSFLAGCAAAGDTHIFVYNASDDEWRSPYPRSTGWIDCSSSLSLPSQPIMTVSNLSVTIAEYKLIGDVVFYSVDLTVTLSGSADDGILIAGFPVNFDTAGNLYVPAQILDSGANNSAGYATVSTADTLDIGRYDGGNYTASGTVQLRIGGSAKTES